jgi:hypothetical protein
LANYYTNHENYSPAVFGFAPPIKRSKRWRTRALFSSVDMRDPPPLLPKALGASYYPDEAR